MADVQRPTGPVFRVEKIEDNATPEGLAAAAYNFVNSSTEFTGGQKDVLNALVAVHTGYRPAGYDTPEEVVTKDKSAKKKKAEADATNNTGDTNNG